MSEAHWNRIYQTKPADTVSWFEAEPTTSLELVRACGVSTSAAVLDVGAGASRLVDGLLLQGFTDVTLLDLSSEALAVTRARLEANAKLAQGAKEALHTVVGDVGAWQPERKYALWHDRAVFHFLTSPEGRAQYLRALAEALEVGGHAIVGTFALDGPERCSNLPVQRYSAETLAEALSPVLELVESRAVVHTTPSGGTQSFVFGRFRRP